MLPLIGILSPLLAQLDGTRQSGETRKSGGWGGEEDLGTELHSQEFPISKLAVNEKFTPKITYEKDLHALLAL